MVKYVCRPLPFDIYFRWADQKKGQEIANIIFEWSPRMNVSYDQPRFKKQKREVKFFWVGVR